MPKKVDMQEKRSALISASVNVIASEGLSAATLRRIAAEASCTTGTLMHYFVNRRMLLLETLRAVHESAGLRMAKAMTSGGADREILIMVLLESLPLDDVRLKEWRVWLAFWSASMDDEALTAENSQRYEQWFALLESLVAPLIVDKNLNLKVRELIALVDGLGIGIARRRISGENLKTAQEDCSILLNHYMRVNSLSV